MARQLAEAEKRLEGVVTGVKKNSPEHKALEANAQRVALDGEYYTAASSRTATPESIFANSQARHEIDQYRNKQRRRLFGGRRFAKADTNINQAAQSLINEKRRAKYIEGRTSAEESGRQYAEAHSEVAEQLSAAVDTINAQPDTSLKETAVTQVRRLKKGVQQAISCDS